MKMENFSDIPFIDDRIHGKKGWLHLKRGKLEKGFHPELLAVAMGDMGMPFRNDFYDNPSSFAGIGWTDMQMHNDGRRSNAAVDLLLPTLEKSKKGANNLQVLTDKLVTKVLFDKTRAVGVEVIDGARAYKVDAAHKPESRSAPRITIKAKKEVILCGGAFNTPQLLMLSGIGGKDQLKQFNVPLLKELAGVGEHLLDHDEIGHIFEMKNLPDKLFRWQNTFLAEAGPQFASKADPSSFTENYIPLVMDWFSGHDKADPMHPDLHIHLLTVLWRDFNLSAQFNDKDPLKANFLGQFLSHVDPKSPKAYTTFLLEVVKPQATKGKVALLSPDPTEAPLVDMALHSAEADVSRLALGVELVRKMMAHPTLAKYEAVEINPGPSYKTLDQVKDYIRKYSSFGHHIGGTAKMGNGRLDPMSVVDSQLRVHGIDGLRVCDASIFPEQPAYKHVAAVVRGRRSAGRYLKGA